MKKKKKQGKKGLYSHVLLLNLAGFPECNIDSLRLPQFLGDCPAFGSVSTMALDFEPNSVVMSFTKPC